MRFRLRAGIEGIVAGIRGQRRAEAPLETAGVTLELVPLASFIAERQAA
jgi:hypothetical protein